MAALLDVTLPIFLVVGFGYLAVWRNYLDDTAISGIMSFAQNIALPCLLFRAISTFDMAQHFDWRLLASYYTGSLAGFFLGFIGAIYLFKRTIPDAIAIGFAAMYANSVAIGLPVSERAFGTAALGPNFAIVSIHAPFCYLVGITAMEIANEKGEGLVSGLRSVARSMSLNPLMIAISLGFIVNLASIPTPEIFANALDMVARAALPTALFTLGGVLVRYRPEGDLVQIGFVCVISLIVHPAIVFAMSKVTGISVGATQSAVVTASMATGVNAYIFANMYGRARRVAASAVLIGTASSIITVSAWLALIG